MLWLGSLKHFRAAPSVIHFFDILLLQICFYMPGLINFLFLDLEFWYSSSSGLMIKYWIKTAFEIQKQPPRGVPRKKVFWKYAGNLQENTHAEVCNFIEITFGMVVLL